MPVQTYPSQAAKLGPTQTPTTTPDKFQPRGKPEPVGGRGRLNHNLHTDFKGIPIARLITHSPSTTIDRFQPSGPTEPALTPSSFAHSVKSLRKSVKSETNTDDTSDPNGVLLRLIQLNKTTPNKALQKAIVSARLLVEAKNDKGSLTEDQISVLKELSTLATGLDVKSEELTPDEPAAPVRTGIPIPQKPAEEKSSIDERLKPWLNAKFTNASKHDPHFLSKEEIISVLKELGQSPQKPAKGKITADSVKKQLADYVKANPFSIDTLNSSFKKKNVQQGLGKPPEHNQGIPYGHPTSGKFHSWKDEYL